MALQNQLQRLQERYNNIGFGVYINYTQKEKLYSKKLRKNQQLRFRNALIEIPKLNLPSDPDKKITKKSLGDLIKKLDQLDWSIKASFMECHDYIIGNFFEKGD